MSLGPYRVDSRPGRSFFEPCVEVSEAFMGAFCPELDVARVQVAYPSDEAKTFRLLLSPVAEANTLDRTGDDGAEGLESGFSRGRQPEPP